MEAFVAGRRGLVATVAITIAVGVLMWATRPAPREQARLQVEVISCPVHEPRPSDADRQRLALVIACTQCECEWSACGCPCEPCEQLRAGGTPSQACLDERAHERARVEAMQAELQRLHRQRTP